MARRDWPDWWDWELELSPHLLKRMIDRRFTEIDLRRMLSDAQDVCPDAAPGRWIADTSLRRHPWKVVVEPDPHARVLVVVTAYPVDR